MERKVYFEPGYDKRSSDPSKNYGINGMQIRFVLKGERGAIQFLLMTDWFPPHVQQERWRNQVPAIFEVSPMAADIGYHALDPQYEGQGAIDDACPILDGKPCYYDGSSLNAEPIRDRFLAEGDAAVWEELERWYKNQFGALA